MTDSLVVKNLVEARSAMRVQQIVYVICMIGLGYITHWTVPILVAFMIESTFLARGYRMKMETFKHAEELKAMIKEAKSSVIPKGEN